MDDLVHSLPRALRYAQMQEHSVVKRVARVLSNRSFDFGYHLALEIISNVRVFPFLVVIIPFLGLLVDAVLGTNLDLGVLRLI